ncbi:NlpC/P60 family protein [Streptomyces sp. NPDC085931]|uniref:C40 family peptidase n=1 Tax=Streptomyces sp. NPDC085931 TaxID=3365740 RepID=UPI0037D15350
MLPESERPTPEEVQRYVDSLYDRAESDTGTFNATRAAAMIPRQRGTAARDRSQKDTEPAIGNLARQWLDAARAKLGPTVAASQPDRRPAVAPDRAPRAARPVERAPEPLALEAPKAPKAPTALAADRAALPGGSPQMTTTGSLPALPDQRVALAGAGRSGQDEWATGARSALTDDAARWPLYEPASASDAHPGSLPDPQPAVPDPLVDGYRTQLPAGGAATYADLPPADVTASYPVVQPADTTTQPSVGGAATYADLPPTDVTAAYPTAQPAETTTPFTSGAAADLLTASSTPGAVADLLTASSTPGAVADPLTAPYPAALPDLAAPVLEAPVPVLLTAPAVPPGPVLTASPVAGMPWGAPDAGHRTRAERVIAFAREQLGRPCVWGAVGPGSYDAPGLTQAAWKAAGVTLPRTAQAQWEAGAQVPLAGVRAGDLVFFHDDLGHVGIWSGDGMMIHAPGPGALIREESVFFAGQSAIRGAVRPT